MSESKVFGVLLDCSWSMTPSLTVVKKALTDLYLATIAQGDQLAVWTFSDWLNPAARPLITYEDTSEVALENIQQLELKGATFLSDALDEVCAALLAKDGRPTLIIILDGQPIDDKKAVSMAAHYHPRVEIILFFLTEGYGKSEIVAAQNALRALFPTRLETVSLEELPAALLTALSPAP